MSAAADLQPYLLEADRRRPELKAINTAQSCFDLLQLTLQLAGPDWGFIGKTRTMDGASVTPPGFTPLQMDLIRPDGQKQRVEIVGLGMDAAWHIPSHRQVKVIANSSANDDPNPEIHGPAKLTPYDIDPQYYRWHNPVVPQFGSVSVPPVPAPQPPPPAPSKVLPKGEAFAKLQALNAFYQAPEGLQRPGGLVRPDGEGRSVADMEAIAQWFYQLVIEGVSIDQVFAQIRSSDEWRSKHP